LAVAARWDSLVFWFLADARPERVQAVTRLIFTEDALEALCALRLFAAFPRLPF